MVKKGLAVALGAVFAAAPLCAGDLWQGEVLIIGSERNVIGDYREDFAQFRAYEANRDAIRTRWIAACAGVFDGDSQIWVASSDVEVGADPQMQPGYWVILVTSSTEPEVLRNQAKACAPDAYMREIWIASPTRHPVCSWACENDKELYFERCAETDYNAILPEEGENPFVSCAISDADYSAWREASGSAGAGGSEN